jgi:hypothetical protein
MTTATLRKPSSIRCIVTPQYIRGLPAGWGYALTILDTPERIGMDTHIALNNLPLGTQGRREAEKHVDGINAERRKLGLIPLVIVE